MPCDRMEGLQTRVLCHVSTGTKSSWQDVLAAPERRLHRTTDLHLVTDSIRVGHLEEMLFGREPVKQLLLQPVAWRSLIIVGHISSCVVIVASFGFPVGPTLVTAAALKIWPPRLGQDMTSKIKIKTSHCWNIEWSARCVHVLQARKGTTHQPLQHSEHCTVSSCKHKPPVAQQIFVCDEHSCQVLRRRDCFSSTTISTAHCSQSAIIRDSPSYAFLD